MSFIKHLLYLLLLPSVMYGQAVHIEDERIVYKGAVKVGQMSKDQLYKKALQAIYDNVNGSKKNILEDNKQDGKISVTGIMKLTAPYHLIRTVGYVLELYVGDGGYKYRIDSVYMKQVERGGKTTKMSSAEVFKGSIETGPQSIEAEKVLNEIDLRFQKMLVLINNEIMRQFVASP